MVILEKKFKFTVLSAVYNTARYLRESIESIINQDVGFEENIQLILVDDGSTDNSYDIALEYQKRYPDNIVVLTQENSGPGSARNLGLKYIEGEYVNFLDSDDLLSSNAMSVIDDFLSDYDVEIVSIPLIYFGGKEGDHHLNYKFETEGIIDLTDKFDYPQASMASSFIKASLLEDQQFNADLINGEDLLLLNKILIHVKKYGVTNRAQYMYRKRAESSSIMDNSKRSERFFLEKMQLCYKGLIDYSLKTEGEVLKFIQYIIALDLNAIVESHSFEEVYSDSKKSTEFWECFEDILSYIDEDTIKNHLYLEKDVKSFYIYIKNNNDFNITVNERRNRVFIKSDDYLINRLHGRNIFFDIIDIKNNFIYISGCYVSNCYPSSMHFQANAKTPDGKIDIYDCKYVEYPTTYRTTKKMLNIPWKFYYNFDVKIPIEDDNLKITFDLLFDENGESATFKPNFKFRNICYINKFINYYVDGSKIVLYKDKAIHVVDYAHIFRLKLELKSIFKILISGEDYNVYNIFIRFISAFAYIFMKNRRIWLFMDRPTDADDNAKHLFEYSIKQNDGIEKYFIVDKKSPDYKKMLKISKNIIPWGSLKHKIYYIYAEKFISTHVDHVWVTPFYYKKEKFTNGLVANKLYFLQHGVTKDDISHWLRKFYHNFYLLLTVSDYEKESFLSENYNYDEDVVQTLGFPRFDGLEKNQSNKYILFMPTWRNYLINEDSFIKSDYYEILNNFFNDGDLLRLMKDNGYKIIFKPHFNLLEFLHLLNVPEEIEISTEESYQTLFNNSSLLITDYSSVFFDFSYLKKPVIYYHADDNYHYGAGYFDYETMGFGEVIKSEENLVEKIKYYLENDCEMEETYRNRVEDFFKYTDKNNCRRVYEWILEEG